MTRSPKHSAVALAGLSLMILAGACSRNNESTGQSNRGSTQTQGSDSATQYNNNQGNINPSRNNDQTGGATSDLQKDLADFRTGVDKKVADNARAISDKRGKLSGMRSSMRAEFAKMLDDAEQHNNQIRDKVLNYAPSDRTAFDQFRNETNQALDAVTASLSKVDIK